METMPDVTCFFHPVLASRALGKKPRRVEIAGRAYVLFRDASGRPAALLDRCPHRFAPLSRGRVRPDGRLACPYHGWHFDARGQGQSPTQPSLTRCDVEAFQVVERHGYLWLAGLTTPLEAFPTLGWEGYEFAGAFSMLFRAPLHVALDNFSEDEHTPFVHTRLGWDESAVGQVEFEAKSFDDRTEVHYRAPQRPSLLTPLLLVKQGDFFHNDWETRFDPVRTRYDIYWKSPEGELRPLVTRSVIFMVPETSRTTRFHVFIFTRLLKPSLRPLLPIIRRATVWLGWAEVYDDARFIPAVADTPFEMRGMRLGKFDKPLVQNHKLLRSIYWRLPTSS